MTRSQIHAIHTLKNVHMAQCTPKHYTCTCLNYLLGSTATLTLNGEAGYMWVCVQVKLEVIPYLVRVALL